MRLISVLALLSACVLSSVVHASECKGFSEDSTVFSDLPEVRLAPETGTFGRFKLNRGGLDYSARTPTVVILNQFGRCPSPMEGAALCGLNAGGKVLPQVGASLTRWSVVYAADQLSLTVRRLSHQRAHLTGDVWRARETRGTIGYCGSERDPIVEILVNGQNVTLAQPRHGFAPFGRHVLVSPRADVATRGKAAIADYQNTVKRINAQAQARIPSQNITVKYARLLGMPLTSSNIDVMRAIARDGRYLQAYLRETNANAASVRRRTQLVVDNLTAVLDQTLARIGYSNSRADPSRLIAADEDPLRFVTSTNADHPVAVADRDPVAAQKPLNILRIAMPDLMEGLGENIIPVCTNVEDCEYNFPYDLVPRQFYVTFSMPTVPRSEIEKIVRQDGYRLSIKLEGTSLQFGPIPDFFDPPNQPGQGASAFVNYSEVTCPAGESCFTVAILTIGTPLASAPMPWDIELEVLKYEPLSEPVIVDVDPNGNVTVAYFEEKRFARKAFAIRGNDDGNASYFAAALLPTYTSERCESCHGFETEEALLDHHGFVSGLEVDLQPSLYVPGAHVMACQNCHNDIYAAHPVAGEDWHETEWRVPYIDLGVNWSEKTPSEICNRTKTNLPTVDSRERHFHGDLRLFWAIENGETPFGQQLSKAPPYDFVEFLRYVDNWNYNGAPCP